MEQKCFFECKRNRISFQFFPTFAAFRDEKILFLNRKAKKCVADVAVVVFNLSAVAAAVCCCSCCFYAVTVELNLNCLCCCCSSCCCVVFDVGAAAAAVVVDDIAVVVVDIESVVEVDSDIDVPGACVATV